MYNDLKGKNVLVTGGTKGIGKAISLGFAVEGARVISISRHIPEDTDDRILYYNCDVSNSNDVKNTIEAILSKFNSIDILVNNAGLEEYARLDKTDESMWDKIMDTNVKGVYNVSKYCIPDMIKNHGGNIINISSVQANIITKNAAAYVTSKHAIIGLTKSIALDYAPEIRCNAVLPATIDTPLVRKAAILEVGCIASLTSFSLATGIILSRKYFRFFHNSSFPIFPITGGSIFFVIIFAWTDEIFIIFPPWFFIMSGMQYFDTL